MIISGIDRSRYFRQDFVDIGERFAQLIERKCGIWPVLFVPVETELDVARLHERGHQVAEGGSVLRGSEVWNGECYCRRIAMINRYGPFMTCGSTYSLFSVAGQQRADAR